MMSLPLELKSTLAAAFLGALVAFSSPLGLSAKPLDLDRLREEAKGAYAKGDYRLAQRNMAKVVQVLPLSASDYLMLARSAYSAEDHARASAAYSFYFQLNRRPDQRPKDEYKRVKSLVTAQKDKRFIEATLERIKLLEALTEKGELEGSKGALKALNRLRREGLFHPRLHRVYKSIQAALERAQNAALNRWWAAPLRVEAAELRGLDERWASWDSSGLASPEASEAPRAQLKAIQLMSTSPEEALTLLKQVSQRAGSYELSQRYLLLIALVKAGDTGEALELTRSLLTRAQGADVLRLSLLEAQLLAQVSQAAGQAPTEEQLAGLADQLYLRNTGPEPTAAQQR